MQDNPIIQVRNLTKVYKSFDRREGITGAIADLFKRNYHEVRAVDDISFDIGKGEMVGYIGANGAGKSTTIKMLTGILTPTSGTIRVSGLDPQRNRYPHARQIGVVFGQRTQLWWDLAVIEAFNLLQKIYQVPIEDYRKRLDRFVQVLDIGGQLHAPVRKLSLGQRMKCDLCASLLHNPPLLFLDEPTIGLDVAVKERIRRFIRHINMEETSTVILTTHDLTDIEELCGRIIIIDSGKVLFDGPTEEIKERYGKRRRIILEIPESTLGSYIDKPLPPAEAPILFAGYQPRLTGAVRDGKDRVQTGVDPSSAATSTELEVGNDVKVSQDENGSGDHHVLDEPGARQFMAELSRVMDDGSWLKVRRLNLRQYQVSFDRNSYTAREVISRLLDRFSVEDLELREPELSDIIRAIYEGKQLI